MLSYLLRRFGVVTMVRQMAHGGLVGVGRVTFRLRFQLPRESFEMTDERRAARTRTRQHSIPFSQPR